MTSITTADTVVIGGGVNGTSVAMHLARMGAALVGMQCLVYDRCMSRTNVDIDDQACAEVMRRYRLATKREAINFALRTIAAEPASVEEARSLRGIGWEGNLETMRSTRSL